jgi:glycosyltransferase involved in cell wall biosynthesis
MKMKIAILSVPTNFHCQKWANALVRAGADVTVISLQSNAIRENNLFENIYIPPKIWINGQFRYPSYWFARKELANILHDRKIDILHPLHVTPFGTWARWTGFQPTIVAAIGADILEYTQEKILWDSTNDKTKTNAYAKIKKYYFKHAVQKALDYARLITADNQTLIDAIQSEFKIAPEKIRLVRWGIEPEIFNFPPESRITFCHKLQIPINARLVLSPRGANAFYQGEIILDAYQKLLEDNASEHYFVFLASEYKISPTILAKAELFTKKYSKFRWITEPLSRSEMAVLWTMTDVFISAPQYDGYSASIAEGRYIGAIPIVNNIPGNCEVITHNFNGIIIHPFNSDELSNAMRNVLRNIITLKPLFAERNRTWITKHSLLQDHATEFLRICESL